MYKVWPLAKARELLVKALDAFDDTALVLTGGRRERETVATLAAGLPTQRVINLCGELNILETAACLKLASCVVAPDTGVLHLAAALDVPIVGLYAATLPSLVGPRAHGAPAVIVRKPQTCDPCLAKQCPYLPRNCMNQIATDEVFNTLARTLALGRA
jgi:heptosyltransferase-2